MAETIVARQVHGSLQRRMFLEIEGSSADDRRHGAKAASNEGCVGRLMRTDRQVASQLYEVDCPEFGAQVDGGFRMRCQEVSDARGDKPRDGLVAVDLQLAAW